MLQMASILSVLTILMVPFSNQFQNEERDILNHFPNINALSDEKEYTIAPIAQGCPSLEPDVDSIQNSPIVDTHSKSLSPSSNTSILATEDISLPPRVRKKKDLNYQQGPLRDQKNHVNKVRKAAAVKAAAEFVAKALAVTLSSADSSANPRKKQKLNPEYSIKTMTYKNLRETKTKISQEGFRQHISGVTEAGLANDGEFAEIAIHYLISTGLSLRGLFSHAQYVMGSARYYLSPDEELADVDDPCLKYSENSMGSK